MRFGCVHTIFPVAVAACLFGCYSNADDSIHIEPMQDNLGQTLKKSTLRHLQRAPNDNTAKEKRIFSIKNFFKWKQWRKVDVRKTTTSTGQKLDGKDVAKIVKLASLNKPGSNKAIKVLKVDPTRARSIAALEGMGATTSHVRSFDSDGSPEIGAIVVGGILIALVFVVAGAVTGLVGYANSASE
ncbi:hypothetical protein GN244_ATG10285 [Phytophthora infestans]|uniref:Secreted RxLR effector peptide protein n=1 Tax=Phytophthora infestans TaxID=4787 RepID=A0A833WUA5_PHYIN|nr:hypothetical protein GN244_ATG10285 [Phytophthora infestans]KAF4139757.1 hypothetical protein GN958_ATG10998 [Phytophthora infestans]